MSRINSLEVRHHSQLLLSSHPLEEVHIDDALQAIERFIHDLKEKSVGTVVVLLPSHELHDLYGDVNLLDEYRRHGLEVLHFPLENFSVPEKTELFHEMVDSILQKLKSAPVLIHCMAGCGRTGMMAAGVLVRLGWSATDAIEEVRRIRPGSMDVLRQILFLRGYQRYLRDNRRS